MIVGYGFKVDRGSLKVDDTPILQEIGCEKVFVNESHPFSDFELQQVLDFLRQGDVLSVVDLARLGRDVYEIIAVVERLRKLGVTLRAERNKIIPGTAIAEHFLGICAMFAELHEAGEKQKRRSVIRSRRGRPTALSDDDRLKAHRLLNGGHTPVLEVARQLGVSPATIYRYFPRQERRSRIPRKR